MDKAEATKMLWEFYGPEEKGSFFPAYIYLKYIDYFMEDIQRALGSKVKPNPRGELDPTVKEFLGAYRNIIGQGGGSRETNTYHGKVVKVNEAVQFASQKTDLNLPVSETIVPYKLARDVIIKNPESIALGSCVCRAVGEHSCLPAPMDVCLFIGDPFATFMIEHNPLFRRVSRDEAVNVIEESHKKGFVQSAWFKAEMRNRFTSICNCCSCCCMGIKAFHLLGMGDKSPFLAPSGHLAHIDEDCTGCGECVDACHFKALSLDEEKGMATVKIQNCMGCGVCEDLCPAGAITLKPEPSKCEPLNIEMLVRELELQ